MRTISGSRLTVDPLRKAFLVLALAGFGIGTGEFVLLTLLPNVAADLSVTIPQAGHLVSAYAVGVVVGAPTLTIACVRLPRNAVLIGLLAAFALGNVASALAPSFDWELLARFASGLPHGAFSASVRWWRPIWFQPAAAARRWR